MQKHILVLGGCIVAAAALVARVDTDELHAHLVTSARRGPAPAHFGLHRHRLAVQVEGEVVDLSLGQLRLEMQQRAAQAEVEQPARHFRARGAAQARFQGELRPSRSRNAWSSAWSSGSMVRKSTFTR